MLSYDDGTVYVNGHALGKEDDLIRSTIGIVFQDNMMDGELTVEENLYIRGRLYTNDKKKLKLAVNQAITIVNANDLRQRRYGQLSGGQKRKIDVARALLNTPKILILDEPTTGLDPQTRKSIWDMLLLLKKEKRMTIFLTTHYMEEAALADHIVVIDKGKIVEEGTPATIKDKYCNDSVIMQVSDMNAAIDYMTQSELAYELQGDEIKSYLKQTRDAIQILSDLNDLIISFEVKKGTLDEAFIRIVGGNHNEDND